MRIIVCGGRDYPDRERVFEALDRLHKEKGITCIIHGACPTGADKWADEWAKEREVKVEAYEADWLRLGRYGGPERNQRMAEAKPDGCVAFPRAGGYIGSGTADMCRRAKEPPPIGPGIKVWYPCVGSRPLKNRELYR